MNIFTDGMVEVSLDDTEEHDKVRWKGRVCIRVCMWESTFFLSLLRIAGVVRGR